MRLGVIADTHVDRVTDGRDRYPEIVTHRDWFVEECRERAINLVVHCGDWADPGADELRDQVRIAESAHELASCSTYGLITIPGNHDVVLGTETMSTLTPMRVSMLGNETSISILERPAVFWNGGSFIIVAAPYPHDTRDYLLGDSQSRYLRELKRVTDLSHEYAASKLVVVSHLMLDVCEGGEESDEMRRGDDCTMPTWLLDRADIVLQGHYHRRQHHFIRDCNIYVPGSPIRHTFSEQCDAEKGAWFLDV